MNRRQFITLSSAAAFGGRGIARARQSAPVAPQANQELPERLLLKDYRPQSIYQTPKTEIKRAKFPVVDVHCHGIRPVDQLDDAVKLMDAVGVQKAKTPRKPLFFLICSGSN
jgi:hypothetical protein